MAFIYILFEDNDLIFGDQSLAVEIQALEELPQDGVAPGKAMPVEKYV